MSMELIQTIEINSPASSITFSSIPQDYDHLQILVSARSTRSSGLDNIQLFINGNESNLTHVRCIGSGTSMSSSSGTLGQSALPPADTTTSNTFGNASYYFASYTSANIKSVLTDGVGENNSSSAFQTLYALSWNDTSAISSIILDMANGNFAQNSIASLYGITTG